MREATPRMKALLAGGATMLVFGMIIPANASPEPARGGQPGIGQVGMADEKANPRPQSSTDGNAGFTCDTNNGAGDGNPALSFDCGDGGGESNPTSSPTAPGKSHSDPVGNDGDKPGKGGTEADYVPDGT